MADVVRWDPFGQMMSLRQAVDRLFEDSVVRPSRLLSTLDGAATFQMDIYQTQDEVVVKAVIPGVNPSDLDVSITGETLSIKGEIKEEEVKDAEFLLRERRFGTFTRTVTLPFALDNKRAEASFENGVCAIRIPKAEEAKPKAIKVKVQKTL